MTMTMKKSKYCKTLDEWYWVDETEEVFDVTDDGYTPTDVQYEDDLDRANDINSIINRF